LGREILIVPQGNLFGKSSQAALKLPVFASFALSWEFLPLAVAKRAAKVSPNPFDSFLKEVAQAEH
jgi:hypothetical protein